MLKANGTFPVAAGCDWDKPDSCSGQGNECCAQVVMKDTYTEVIQTKEMCLNMSFETGLEPLELGEFKYKIKCGGFSTSEWKGFNTKSRAYGIVAGGLAGIGALILM